ncbi:CU044_2847 family protein [Actinophytocola sediminis]
MTSHHYLLEVPVAGGNPVLVEVRDPSPDDLVPAARPGTLVSRANSTLQAALADLQPTIRALADWAKDASPDEFGVEFGIKLGGQANAIIASGSAEVNFIVKLTWKR